MRTYLALLIGQLVTVVVVEIDAVVVGPSGGCGYVWSVGNTIVAWGGGSRRRRHHSQL